jgi:UDPglucose 6-dehydrogenase
MSLQLQGKDVTATERLLTPRYSAPYNPPAMNVAVIGTGYVGLVAGVCLAELGHTVVCVDTNEEKIARLNEGILPIYEPGLEKLIPDSVANKRLTFTTDIGPPVKAAEVVFIAVGTPSADDGSANLDFVMDAAKAIGKNLDGFTVVAVKSTVPVGTCAKVRATIGRESKEHFAVVSNPEFLREGVAIPDFMSPDRILIGAASRRGRTVMHALYEPLAQQGARIVNMDIASAELSKYAANAMLATRISFMNNLAHLCEKVGADVEYIRHAMGSDGRIGPAFLRAGIGYGGSCFPKDIKALLNTAESNGVALPILQAVEEVNRQQKGWLVSLVKSELGADLSKKTIALWGLAFKPETDDMRQAPALTIIQGLLDAGATINAFDPQAEYQPPDAPKARYTQMNEQYDTLRDADALLLLTEWKSFAVPDWRRMKRRMKGNRVYDGRNLWEPAKVRAEGFRYRGVGRS